MGRRWPLALGHAVLAAAMVMTGIVTAFPALLVTQLLWGIGWARAGIPSGKPSLLFVANSARGPAESARSA